MAVNPFMDRNNDTTRKFLCCLKNRTDTNERHLNGLTPEEVYNKIVEGQALQGPEGVHKTPLINQLVTACELNGYIERVWIWWRPPSWWTSPWDTASSPQLRWRLPTLWEPLWGPQFWWQLTWSGRIRMTPAGIDLCKSDDDGKSYCSKVPSYKD
jgi:hypothetical protein